MKRAAEILSEKVRLISRRALADENEELQAIVARYLRVAQEGAARRNLELMAQVIAGMAEQESVEADAFLKHSNILADLSKDEIRLLSSIMVVTQHDETPRRLGRNAVDGGQPLIPVIYADNRKVIEACAALIRTGYVMPLSQREGHMSYRTTAAFEELAQLVDLTMLRFDEDD